MVACRSRPRHINPMLAVCRHLVRGRRALHHRRSRGVAARLESPACRGAAGRISFATIPNVIPSEHGHGADHIGFIMAVHTRMAAAVERLLDRLLLEQKRRPDAIVAGTYLAWGVAVGRAVGSRCVRCGPWPPRSSRRSTTSTSGRRWMVAKANKVFGTILVAGSTSLIFSLFLRTI